MNIEELRKEYQKSQLSLEHLDSDPILQFRIWLQESIQSKVLEPTAMTLSTSDGNGKVSSRIVLAKGIEPEGVIFYTNKNSQKGTDLERNSQAATLFFWRELERQVRMEGMVAHLDESLATKYFHSRPRDSQIGAWASSQSKRVTSRLELEKKVELYKKKFVNLTVIPKPAWWGGYIIYPKIMEFWQGRKNRLHDRFQYKKKNNSWVMTRLYP